MTAIIVSWNSDRACDPAYVASHYIAAADQLTCTVALDPHKDGMVLGFQSLKLAQAKNIYDVAPGWGLSGPMLHLIPAEKVSVGGCLMPLLSSPNRLDWQI